MPLGSACEGFLPIALRGMGAGVVQSLSCVWNSCGGAEREGECCTNHLLIRISFSLWCFGFFTLQILCARRARVLFVFWFGCEFPSVERIKQPKGKFRESKVAQYILLRKKRTRYQVIPNIHQRSAANKKADSSPAKRVRNHSIVSETRTSTTTATTTAAITTTSQKSTMKVVSALLLALAAAGPTTSAVELTPETWEAAVAGKTVFIKFLAPW